MPQPNLGERLFCMTGTQGTADNNFQISVTPGQSPIPQIQTDYGNLEKNYSSAIAAQPTVPQLTSKYNDQFGVPQLQQVQQGQQAQYSLLGDQISAVPKDIEQGSQESILTQGQLSRMTEARQAPLRDAQGKLGTQMTQTGQNLATAQTNANQMITAESVQQAKELLPFTQAFTDENIISAMQNSNFTTSEASELSVLLSNRQAGQTWTNAQADRANALALKEQDFENSLKLQNNTASINKDYFTFANPDPLGLGL